MRKKLTTDQFIERAKLIHGDRYDYSEVEYVDAITPVMIICSEHGCFTQTPNYHSRGYGCPSCGSKLKITTDQFIERAKSIHGDRYDYSMVEYTKARNKVNILCSEHGKFKQTPSNHLTGRGCPSCACMLKSTTNQFIERAKLTHGDRYDYSMVNYVNNYTKVNIICSEHGHFAQTPNSHLSGNGCRHCGRQTLTTDQFIERAKLTHGDRYDYSEVEYVNNRTTVMIICSEHGHFKQTPNIHLSGKGCPSCGGKLKLTANQFIERAKLTHGDRYDYSMVEYVNSNTKVNIICSEHGEFKQVPYSHLSGQGCPSCSITGFDMSKNGTLYILRSECGMYFKAGISNNPKRRIVDLRRRTPFEFEPIAKINNKGDVVFKLEKAFHSSFESAQMKGFDGCTEWFKWEHSVNDWISILSI